MKIDLKIFNIKLILCIILLTECRAESKTSEIITDIPTEVKISSIENLDKEIISEELNDFSEEYFRLIEIQPNVMYGDDVYNIQKILLTYGFNEIGEADGYYGKLTEGAIKKIQNYLGATQNGKVDKELWNFIFDEKNGRILKHISNDIIQTIISYQNRVESWLNKYNIISKYELLNYDGMELFISPSTDKEQFGHLPIRLINMMIYDEIFENNNQFSDWFVVGKYLSLLEKDRIYAKAYACIPENIKQKFHPFRTFDNFCNSLVFNPSILIGNDPKTYISSEGSSREYSSYFVNDYAYLIFLFNLNIVGIKEDIEFNHQLEQLINNHERDFLLFKGDMLIALFEVNITGNLEFVFYDIHK